MKEEDGKGMGVRWSLVPRRGGGDRAGHSKCNFPLFCFLFFCLEELGGRRSGSPGTTRYSWGRGVRLKAEKWLPLSKQRQAAAMALRAACSGIVTNNKKGFEHTCMLSRRKWPAAARLESLAIGIVADSALRTASTSFLQTWRWK